MGEGSSFNRDKKFDAQGTFFQQEEPSYDIEVTNDLLDQNGLYKHIQQSWIL